MDNASDVKAFENLCSSYCQAYPVIDSIVFPKTNVRANVCQVTTTWFGFYRFRKGSNQIIDSVDLALPQYSYESQVNLGTVRIFFMAVFCILSVYDTSVLTSVCSFSVKRQSGFLCHNQ